MFLSLFFAWCLMAANVACHAIAITSALRWVRRVHLGADNARRLTWILVGLAGWMILFHLLEITVWALFYVWQSAMPDLPDAIYFSAVTYTTTGYGDLLLPRAWRLVGAIEALTGILMCGWSTGFFFAVVARMVDGKPPK
jgi:voltage-gated potassium channel Kch